MNKEHKEQAAFIEKNIEAVLDDIKKNRKRLVSGVFEKYDYDHGARFAFANWVKPKSCQKCLPVTVQDGERRIYYRIFVNSLPDEFESGEDCCKDCYYHNEFEDDPEDNPEKHGQCRHDTPYYWKIVRRDDWCGKFKSGDDE